MPPILIVHGGADGEAPVEQARRYCAGIARAGKCQLVEVEGASHRVENWWPSQWGYKRELVSWLRATGTRPPSHRPRRGVVQKDIVYRDSPQLKLDAFVPRGPGPVPAVIVVHGGGWRRATR